MGNVIVELFNKSDMSIREFADAAGLKYSTAHDIVCGKANIENIGAGAFVRIAHVFGTTADALLSGLERQSAQLSPDEQKLVDAYRSCSAQGKTEMLDMAAYIQSRHPLNQAAQKTA